MENHLKRKPRWLAMQAAMEVGKQRFTFDSSRLHMRDPQKSLETRECQRTTAGGQRGKTGPSRLVQSRTVTSGARDNFCAGDSPRGGRGVQLKRSSQCE